MKKSSKEIACLFLFLGFNLTICAGNNLGYDEMVEARLIEQDETLYLIDYENHFVIPPDGFFKPFSHSYSYIEKTIHVSARKFTADYYYYIMSLNCLAYNILNFFSKKIVLYQMFGLKCNMI